MPELIFIAIIALVVLGPQRLPGVLREVAKFITQLRGLANELTSQFSEEIAMIEELDPRKIINEVTQPFNDLTKPLPEKKSTDKKPDKPKSTSAAATRANNESEVAETDGDEKNGAGSSTVQDVETKDESGDVFKSSNGANSTDAKNEPQTQTDPSNVASTEPYKNRTPNLNVIKRPSKDEVTDSITEPESDMTEPESDIAQSVAEQSTSKPFASAQLASGQLPTNQVEENQIAPPAMQEKIAQAKLAQDKSAKPAAVDKSSNNNSDKPAAESVNSDSIETNSDTSTNSVAES